MRRAVVTVVFVLALVAPARALAAGGPVPPVTGPPGVGAAGWPYRFVTTTGHESTLVERVRAADQAVLGSIRIRGLFGVPGAAYDGSTTGLSKDGSTLVLADIPAVYPEARTRLLVLSTHPLRVRQMIRLHGAFTVDAISPTGRWLYLIHYRSATNLTDYEVRAYDLTERRMLPRPIVDPREPDEKMQGVPVTRTMSPDGRWAYTLYLRPSGPGFIHALDTAGLTARCVDLPMKAGTDVSSARLTLGPRGTLRITDGLTTMAVMNTRTFAVTVPRTAPTRITAKRAAAAHRGHQSMLWLLGIVPVLGLLGLALARRLRRPGRPGGWRVTPGGADGVTLRPEQRVTLGGEDAVVDAVHVVQLGEPAHRRADPPGDLAV